jgi:nucleoid-associated protein YgaU
VHTVASGDTLSKLAKAYLGDAGRYMDIFNANSGTLTNPDMIKVGQKLNIPAR